MCEEKVETPGKCKFCKTFPVSGTFGNKWEIYCPSHGVKCPYPPCIEGENYAELVKQWNNQFGDKGEFE